jgi:hypothetical protein
MQSNLALSQEIQVPNGIGALISGVQLCLFAIYPNKPKSRKDVSLI